MAVFKDQRFGTGMFHRRLWLLLGLLTAPLGLLGAPLAYLTLAKSADGLAEAEEKLVRRATLPTTRGRILDRKDRVLAQDRPSYDVAIAFSVLSGRWARAEARAFARNLNRKQWAAMTEAQRVELVERCLPAYWDHLDRAWDLIARTAGMSRQEFDKLRAEATESVNQRVRGVVEARRARAMEELTREGKTPSAEELAQIERRVNQPVAEEQRGQVVLPRVSDGVAFSLQALVGEEEEIAPLGDAVTERAVGESGGDDSRTGRYAAVARTPGLSVIDSGDREYPLETQMVEVDRSGLPTPLRAQGPVAVKVEGVATHMIGWVRVGPQAEDVQRRRRLLDSDLDARARSLVAGGGGPVVDLGEYREQDRVGHTGLEGSFEGTLRGLRGLRTQAMDTREVVSREAEAGRDLNLTIDAVLQARVQAVMDPSVGLAVVQPWHGTPSPFMAIGTPLNGAAVVLDIDTGEILAMVSTPGIPRRVLHDSPEKIFEDKENQPLVNRAVERPYPPGSIVKPLVLSWAGREGAYRPGGRVACTGHLLANDPGKLRCWIFKRGHGTHTDQLGHEVSGPEGIMVSCNIFFFTMGQRLGAEGMSSAYRAFGVGSGWNLGVGNEFAGSVGAMGRSAALTPGDGIMMGIGQGPIAWTPLHAADAYATLARHGVRVRPHVVRGGRGQDPPEVSVAGFAVDDAMEGLRLAISERLGTGHHTIINDEEEPHFNAAGVQIWGKTGTAAARRRVDMDGEGPEPGQVVDLDHSWFVVMVGAKGEGRPRYVISVVMEYAGSGGKVSGPIVNQIILALKAEGYL